MHKILITGANGGIGFELIKKLQKENFYLIATVRNKKSKLELINKLNHNLNNLEILIYDLNEEIPQDVINEIENSDYIINNAGVGGDLSNNRMDNKTNSIFDFKWDELEKTAKINAEVPRKIMSICIPKMIERNFGRVLNVSSARARLMSVVGEESAPCYDISKTILNAYTAHIGQRLRGTNVFVNSMCPGWCKTSMGGENAPENASDGAERIINLIKNDFYNRNGMFFIDNKISHF